MIIISIQRAFITRILDELMAGLMAIANKLWHGWGHKLADFIVQRGQVIDIDVWGALFSNHHPDKQIYWLQSTGVP